MDLVVVVAAVVGVKIEVGVEYYDSVAGFLSYLP